MKQHHRINKKIRAKNFNTLDPTNIQHPSFAKRSITAKKKKFCDKYSVLELFSLDVHGRLLECGNILLPEPITIPKTKRPKFALFWYRWKRVLWWKQWERWVLFDSLSYEWKMSRLIRKQFPEEHLIVVLKRIGFLFDPATYVIKIIDTKTREFVLTNPVLLATTFRKKRKVSTLFEALDVFNDETKASFAAKDLIQRSRNVVVLRKELSDVNN